MDIFIKRFSEFVNISLKILFFLVMLGNIVVSVTVLIKLPQKDIIFTTFISVTLITISVIILYKLYNYLKRRSDFRYHSFIVLGLAFVLRLLLVLLTDTKPMSDFATIYSCSESFAKGEYWVFKGISYLARFPHLTILTIYLGAIQKIFNNVLFIMKLINIVLSTINVYLIYLMNVDLFDSKEKGIRAGLIASVFPPFILYNSVACSENIAMTFFLGSIYCFILVIKMKKNISCLVLSGLLLSIGNLFRMVGYIILIAYIMYLVIYTLDKKTLKSTFILLLAFFIPLYIANSVLLSLGITEYPLWKGREPVITSVLKGTNFSSIGMWNEEDSKIPELYNYDYDKVSEVSKDIIKERLFNTPLYKLVAFYIAKFVAKWSVGDFLAVSWNTGQLGVLNTSANLSTYLTLYCQLFYSILFLFAFLGLFNKNEYIVKKEINLMYIIFCGYGLIYLITEQQSRYSYIVSWLFITLQCSFNGDWFIFIRNKSIYNFKSNLMNKQD